MTRGRSRGVALASAGLAGLVVTFLPLLATPAAAAPAVRLHVATESTCEGAAAFGTRLGARGIVQADDGPDVVDVDVVAAPGGDGATATLVLRRDGRASTRELTAPTCDEVLEAAAFTLTLALEQPIETTSPPLAPARPAPAPVPPPSSASARVPEAPSPPLSFGGAVGVGGLVGAAASPAALLTARADLESSAPRAFAPAASLGVLLALPASTRSGGADVDFALQSAFADACPLRFAFGARVTLRPCAELQVGRLQSRASGITSARLVASPWLALGIAARARVALGLGIGLEATIMAGSPLIQDDVFVGDSRVLSVGPFVGSAAVGVGVHFR